MPKPVPCTQVTVAVSGAVTTKAVTLPAFTRKCILASLGLVRLPYPLTDAIERQDDGSFVVLLSQEKPFTYIRHVFVARTA